MDQLFKQWVKEQQYVKNVSHRTIEWYGCILKAFGPLLGQNFASRGTLKSAVVSLRQRGLSPRSINGYLTGLNAFLRWAHTEGHVKELLVVPKLMCEEKVVGTYTPEHVKKLLLHRPTRESHRRSHALISLLMDTGMRISEAMGLTEAVNQGVDESDVSDGFVSGRPFGR
jgi:site-specific recombinase XerD